ncbi:MAG: hypothetical protein F6J97_12780 [Leptolyngbya sp. SIO4C1]|nr:hypothetical protein [Leptolyngbya sp. SIO4C1]
MRFRAAVVAILVGVMGLLSSLTALPAQALTPIDLEDIHAEPCPAEYAEGIVGAGSIIEATCYLVKGTAINRSGKPVLNADIFGFIYDANNNPVMQNRSRLGSIDYVPPGESEFELRISVASNQPPPLKLEKFKASGFAGKVRR